MGNRALDAFDSLMKQTNKISDYYYKATTLKRRSVVIPEGGAIYDTDENIKYVGNGVTYGGVSDGGNKGVRIITVAAAASGTSQVTASATGDRVLFTDSKVTNLNTGDGLTFAASTGTLPTGISAQEYFIYKPNPATSQFIVCPTRPAALTGSGNYISASGVAGYTTVISTVCVDKGEDTLYVKAAANCTVCVPNETASTDQNSVTIKKSAEAGAVTVSGLGSDGTVSGMNYNGNVSTSIALRASNRDQVTFFLDTAGNEYVTTSLVNS